MSDRNDGDFHPHRVAAPVLDARQRALIGRRFSLADQVHGTSVIGVTQGERWPTVGEADVLVADRERPTAIGVWAADCAPIMLFGDAGTVVGVHAGWRGLALGVVDAALAVLAARNELPVAAVVGPMIHAECYAFDAVDLAAVAAGVGVEPSAVTATTTGGLLALDVPAAVGAALAPSRVAPVFVGSCTGCDDRWFSHRSRRDVERHVLVAWTEPARVTVVK